jgi:hypothetical protein
MAIVMTPSLVFIPPIAAADKPREPATFLCTCPIPS